MKGLFPKLKAQFARILCLLACAAVLIASPCLILQKNQSTNALNSSMLVLSLWQIDAFEGGRGSRADFLQTIADELSENCYVTVTSLSAEAVRQNLAQGVQPDILSFGAGMTGIESYIRGYDTWCYGSYCLLTLDENADFSDITAENTVINGGIDNLIGAAALFCGVNGATVDRPTGAYVKLIGGKYKYLLGTQRDVYRLKTRGVSFSAQPVTAFNDLYQNISIVTTDKNKASSAQQFIDKLLSAGEKIANIGLMKEGIMLYDDELSLLEGQNYEYKLISPIGEDMAKRLESAISAGDINLLKNLLK